MTKARNKVIIGLAVLVTAGSYLYIGKFPQSSADKVVVSRQEQQAQQSIVVHGVAVPVRYAALALPAAGMVAETPVAAGEQVKAGQVLLRLENAEVSSKLRRAQADLAYAEEMLEWAKQNRVEEIAYKQVAFSAAQAELNRAQAEWQRVEHLYNIGGASQQQVDQVNAAYMESKAAAEEARYVMNTAQIGNSVDTIIPARQAAVDSARASVDEIQSQVRQSVVYAPFDGTVAFLNARVGEYATTTVPVIYLGDYAAWQIHTEDVKENQVALIRPGAAAKVTFEAIPGLEISGSVMSVSSYGEKKQEDIIYQVVIKLAQQDARVRWNMKAAITIEP